MARTDRTRAEPRRHATGYRDQGRVFLRAAQALADLSDGDESYGSAIALLAVHSAISHADSLSVGFGGRKSTGTHDQSPSLLKAVLGNRLPTAQHGRLSRLVSLKDAIAYQGKYYPLDEALKQLKAAEQFAAWADRTLEQRPP